MLAYIAQSVPFTPNWNKIKDIVDTSDNRTLKTYFKYLADAYIIRPLMADTDKLKRLEMPEKIFLGNASQLYTLTAQPNIGNVRETFFLSMLTQQHEVTATKNMDFCVDKKSYFEVGGKNKDAVQTAGVSDAYLALDGIEQGAGKRIPLWLFGFLY